jgi:pimeloyl-ACP methyl ester carboxylesterase
LELARWTVEAYADEVVALLASLVGDSVALAGHSFGGYVALAIAERHPNLVAGLGLVASRTVADTNVARQGRRDSIEKVRAHGSRALLPDLAAKLVAPEAPRSLRERAGRLIEVCPPEGIVAGLTAMAARPDRTHVFEEFRHPALVVHGAADQLIPAAEAARVSRSDTWLFRQLLPGVGHMPMWEAPSETAAVLVDWAKVALAQGHPPGALNSARRT